MMEGNWRDAVAVRPPTSPRALLVWLGLLATALQVFVIQTHFHLPEGLYTTPGGPGFYSADSIPLSGSGDHHTLPNDDDPAKCPIVQFMLHAGSFLPPVSPLPFLAAVEGGPALPASFEAAHHAVLSHVWRSRAPPLFTPHA
jgi:hypothetical protein